MRLEEHLNLLGNHLKYIQRQDDKDVNRFEQIWQKYKELNPNLETAKRVHCTVEDLREIMKVSYEVGQRDASVKSEEKF